MQKGFDEGIALKRGYESPIDCLEMNVYEKGAASPTHYHEYVEILYGTNCDITIWINDETINFETGDLVIINPNETHTLYSNSDCSNYIVIKFMPDILQYNRQMPPEIIYILPLLHSLTNSEHIIKKNEGNLAYIKEIVTDIYTEWCNEDFGYELALRSGILKLFLYIVRYWNNNNSLNLFKENDDITSIIYDAAKYCTENYSEVTARQIAEKYSVSYSYFSRKFKEIMGYSFSEYLNEVRIDNARKMLLTTSNSISKIAADTGFSSASHFIYNFRKKTGHSPLSYKNEFKVKYQ